MGSAADGQAPDWRAAVRKEIKGVASERNNRCAKLLPLTVVRVPGSASVGTARRRSMCGRRSSNQMTGSREVSRERILFLASSG